jgi:formate hydrogenlyase transcriptional activator
MSNHDSGILSANWMRNGYNSESEELLDLSTEIALVQDRENLLAALHGKIKKLIPFNDIIITLYNFHLQTHYAFLFYSEKARQDHPDFDTARMTHSPIKDGIVDRTIESDNPVIFQIDDLLENPNTPVYVRFYKKSGIEEFVGVSIRNNSGIFGGLYMFSESKGTYSPELFKVIKTIANQIAAAITNILVHDEIHNKDREKSILLNIGKDLAKVHLDQKLPDVLLRRLNTYFKFDHAAIKVFNSDSSDRFGYSYDVKSHCKNNKEHRDMLSKAFYLDENLHHLLTESVLPVIINIEECLKEKNGISFAAINSRCGIKEIIVGQLLLGDKLIGALILGSDIINGFSKPQLELIQGVCNQVSSAVAGTLFNEEIRARDEEKSRLLILSNELAAARNKSDLHQVVNQSLKELLPYHHAVILKMSNDEKRLNSFLSDPQSKSEKHPNYDRITNGQNRNSDELIDFIFSEGKPLIFDLTDLGEDEDLLAFFRINLGEGMREVMVSALCNGKRKIGILVLFSDRAGHFHKHHLGIIQGLTSQLATAMANITANEKIERQILEISLFKKQLEVENSYLQEEILINHNFSEIIGTSAALRKVFNLVSSVACTSSSVLVLGETGTGKELIARAIHNESPRRDRLMVKVNCATLPANLIESELFGHERGSFTGATEKRVGKFELANNSTLFLDEIGEMPLDLQVKILRALQEKEIERIGGRSTIKIDVRIIAATNRDLENEVHLGNFREDLFYRLNVFPIRLPPLRDRKEDLPMLASHFLLKHAKKAGKNVIGLSEKVIKNLTEYHWPGNVRELEHIVERSVLLTNQPIIKEINLPDFQTVEIETVFSDENCIKTIDELEREHIINVLKFCNWKVGGAGGAAEVLKIPSTTLNSKIKKLGIIKEIAGY